MDETKKQFTRFSGDKEEHDTGSGQFTFQPQYESQDSLSPTQTELASSYPSPVSQRSASSPTMRNMNSYSYVYSDQVPQCIGPPVGEQVYTYFVSNFVEGSTLNNNGYFGFLLPLLRNNVADRNVNPLRLAFSATAMIAFASRQKAPELLPKAEAIYLRALEATFTAIGDPHRARDDSTLACVTLLTTFEVCYRPNHSTLMPQDCEFTTSQYTDLTPSQQLRPSRPSVKSAEAFGSHLDGAVALLKLRGKDLFKTVVGQKIFSVLRSLLVSSNMFRSCFVHVNHLVSPTTHLLLTHPHSPILITTNHATYPRPREASATARPSTPTSSSSASCSSKITSKVASVSSRSAPPTSA